MARVVRRFFQWVGILLLFSFLLLGIGAGLVYWYKDRIIASFVTKVNEKLLTEVKVGFIDLDLFSGFPWLQVRLHQVVIMGSTKNPSDTLASLQQVACKIDVMALYNGQLKIRAVKLQNGFVRLQQLAIGNNYQVFRTDTSSKKPLVLSVPDIRLQEVNLGLKRESESQEFKLAVSQADVSFKIDQDQVEISNVAAFGVEKLKLGDLDFLKGQEVQVNTAMRYNLKAQTLSLAQTDLAIGPAIFSVAGNISTGSSPSLNLKVAAKQTAWQHFTALLPARLARPLDKYQARGQLYFNGTIQGAMGAGHNPAVNFHFGCKGAQLYHPDSKQKLEDVSLIGQIAIPQDQGMAAAKLTLSQVQARLGQAPITAELQVSNLLDPSIKAQLKADLPLAQLMQFIALPQVKSATGQLALDMELEGKLADLKQASTAQRFRAEGEAQLTDVQLALDHGVTLRLPKGEFLLARQDAAFNAMTLQLGRSEAVVQGQATKLVPWLLGIKTPMVFDLDVKARDLYWADMQPLAAALQPKSSVGQALGTKPTQSENSQANASWVGLDLRGSALSFTHNKLVLKRISGRFTQVPNRWRVDNLSFDMAGGQWQSNTTVVPQDNGLQVSTQTTLKRVLADSLFYLFDDFGQNAISHTQLKGRLSAETDLSLIVQNKTLALEPASLKGQVKMTMVDGKLLNYEPMQALAKYFKAEDLANLSFQELNNTFSIADQRITVPEMEIKSSVAYFSIIGSQTFSNDMDYRIRVPLRNFKPKDPDQAFGLVAESAAMGGSLYLTMKGIPPNLKVALDKSAYKASIKESWQQEKREFLDLFKREKPKVDSIPTPIDVEPELMDLD